MKGISFSFLTLSILIACSNGDDVNHELTAKFKGAWVNATFNIEMNTFRNGKDHKTFSVKEGDWEKQMGVRPLLTMYHENGSYVTEHRNLKDSVFLNQAGKWTIIGDSLFMRDTLPEEGNWYRYRIVINGDHCKIIGIEDSDNDGKLDDLYTGELRKVK